MNAFTLKNESNQKQYDKICKQIKEKIETTNEVTKLVFPYRIFQEVAKKLADDGFDILIIEKKTLLGEKNIFKSADNVTLDMILGYKEKGKHYSYLDNYDED